jgi:NAD(P)-dependent dehydrogenase (short-subunit alcohol dehydrogenase family)
MVKRNAETDTAQRVAVVTGGSSGIGEAIARRLAGRGWQCVLLARGLERLETVAGSIGAEAEQCDVADRGQVDRVAAQVLERHPRIHLLVNNAGIPGGGGFVDLDVERIELVTRVNYLGSVWALRAFLPGLERAVPSDVVTIASVAGTISVGASGPYSAAKHAQLAFSRSVAVELAPRGIRVHSIAPGWVDTDRFPDHTLGRVLPDWVVIDPDRVAKAVLRALDRNRREVFVPAWYRPVPVLHALAPGLAARLLSFARERRMRTRR